MRKPFRIAPLSLFETFLWPPNRRRTDYEAYHDLLRRANFHESTVRIRGKEVTLKPNQVLCSLVNLAEDWGWHRSTVSDYLRRLQSYGLATVDTTHKVTILTLYPDGDAPTENTGLHQSDSSAKSKVSEETGRHSTNKAPEHSKSKDSSSDSILKNPKKELLECAGPFAGEEFTLFLMACLAGPKRLKLGPDIMKRIKEAYLDKLIVEGRLNGAEKDRILLSSNGV